MFSRLKCSVQTYGWGKVGNSSTVSQLASLNGDIDVDPKVPYAEYWFGTHHAGPSSIRANDGTADETLGAWLSRNKDALGLMSERSDCVIDDNFCGLPYLAKVLSISKCLSIQAHPDKALAEKLHAERPEVYKDANHKPEMAVALTPFEAMCGFREVSEIVEFVTNVPEFRAVLEGLNQEGTVAITNFQEVASSGDPTAIKSALQDLFRVYANADPTLVASQVDALVKRINEKTQLEAEAEEKKEKGSKNEGGEYDQDLSGKSLAETLAVRLACQFPGDIGVFAPFLLNYLRLQPGDAIFLAANEPHAYVSGDCFEVMANSNNVVRMGCTPKLRDVPVLTEMLTFSSGLPKILEGEPSSDHTMLYKPTDPAVTEFQLERIEIAAGKSCELTPPTTPAIVIVVRGQGIFGTQEISRGQVYIQKATTKLSIAGTGDAGIQVFRVQCRE